MTCPTRVCADIAIAPLAVWSAEPALAGGRFPKINDIAFDGDRTFYTPNYGSGELFAVGIARDGSAQPAEPIVLDPGDGKRSSSTPR